MLLYYIYIYLPIWIYRCNLWNWNLLKHTSNYLGFPDNKVDWNGNDTWRTNKLLLLWEIFKKKTFSKKISEKNTPVRPFLMVISTRICFPADDLTPMASKENPRTLVVHTEKLATLSSVFILIQHVRGS